MTDFDRAEWRKASFSDSQNNCVEIAHVADLVGVRDSKDRLPSGKPRSVSHGRAVQDPALLAHEKRITVRSQGSGYWLSTARERLEAREQPIQVVSQLVAEAVPGLLVLVASGSDVCGRGWSEDELHTGGQSSRRTSSQDRPDSGSSRTSAAGLTVDVPVAVSYVRQRYSSPAVETA